MLVGKCIIAPMAVLPAHLAHRSNHYFGEDILWHQIQHIFERLSLAPPELLLPRCRVVPFSDDSACVFITSQTQLVKGKGPRDDIRGLADASARLYLVSVEDLIPQVVPDRELRVDAPGRGPELGVVSLKRAFILGRMI